MCSNKSTFQENIYLKQEHKKEISPFTFSAISIYVHLFNTEQAGSKVLILSIYTCLILKVLDSEFQYVLHFWNRMIPTPPPCK